MTRFDGDTFIRVSLNDHIESQVFWQGVQEGDRGEIELLKKLLKPDHVFLDVGANIGVFSLVAAKRVFEGSVHAFEPSAYHINKLQENVSLNRFNNIAVHAIGLSGAAGSSDLYFPPAEKGIANTGMASQYKGAGPMARKEGIHCETLDGFVTRHDVKVIDVMKIDVEGAELDVLAGADGCIAKWRPHVVMEVNREHLARAGRVSEEVIDFWKGKEYVLYRIENDGSLPAVLSSDDLHAHQNIYCDPVQRPGCPAVSRKQ